MEDFKEESQFSSLPEPIQLDILKKLNWTDRKNARLTCRHWFTLINQVQKFGFTISDNDFRFRNPIVVKLPFYSRIASLRVFSAFQPLPIYSSSRMDVPKADELFLDEINSEENIIKLLRYYAAECKSLRFQYGCFEIVDDSTRMKMNVVLTNITKFSFSLRKHYFDEDECPNAADRSSNHNGALSEFLAATSMPNLKTFEARWLLWITDPKYSSKASVQKFAQHFGIFLDKHGQLISSLSISYEGSFCAELFRHFAKLPNVIHLTCHTYFLDVDIFDSSSQSSPVLREAVWTALTSYTKLKSFTFGPPPRIANIWLTGTLPENIYTQFAKMVLANNQNTLTTITSSRIHGSLDWIHRHSYPNLRLLEFGVYFEMATLFSNQVSKGYKFQMLHEMKVEMGPIRMLMLPMDGVVESDSGNAFIRWIVQVAPHLKCLTLESPREHGQLTLPLAHVRSLILGLQQLKYFKLRKWDRRAPASSVVEVYNWLENQPQIEHQYSGWDCNILIKSRPFVETIVQAD